MTKEIEIGDTTVAPAGIEEHGETESVKLFGPPGSGKTTNAAARVALLLRDHDYTIGDVCWLTYRKSLAMDTLHRLVDAGVVEGKQLANPTKGATRYIGTTHAVASRAVGGAGEPINSSDKFAFCRSRNIQLKDSITGEETVGEKLFRIFTYARKNLLDPTNKDHLRQIDAWHDLKDTWRGSVPKTYRAWRSFLDDRNKIMFWEQLAAPLREDVTPGKKILVIDEYHDAYPLMANLAEYWADDAEIVMVPGDPHQVINNFDGADPHFYHKLPYPEVELPTAWERPPYEHWYVAKNVLANAHDPPEMDIQNRGSFQVVKSPTFRFEAEEWTVPDVIEPNTPAWFVNQHGKYTMLLARTTLQLDGLARSLEKAGILFETPTSSPVPGWQAPSNDTFSDRVALYNALQKIRRLSPNAFDKGKSGLDTYGGGEDTADPKRIVLEPKEAAILVDHAQSKHLEPSRSDMTETAGSWMDAEESITTDTLDDFATREFWGTYTETYRSVGQLNKTGQATRSTLTGRDRDALQNALRENKHPVDGSLETKLYTIHASKGNQAETVAVWDGVPSRVREGMERSEEERKNEYRTWYVALTRSTDKLFVVRKAFDFMRYSILPRGDRMIQLANRGYEAGERDGVEA